MYAEPIETRISNLMDSKERVVELTNMGWTNKAIANYMGTDHLTVKRLLKRINHKVRNY